MTCSTTKSRSTIRALTRTRGKPRGISVGSPATCPLSFVKTVGNRRATMSSSKFMNFARASLVVIFTAAAATAAYAHHSFGAEFDSNKPMKLQGVVTRLEWTNPHVYLWVDSKDAKTGKVTQWGFEMGP